jgi:nicotinamidase-related amidase
VPVGWRTKHGRQHPSRVALKRGYAAELGYEVKVVRDAPADYSEEEMHAALELNILHYMEAVMNKTKTYW